MIFSLPKFQMEYGKEPGKKENAYLNVVLAFNLLKLKRTRIHLRGGKLDCTVVQG